MYFFQQIVDSRVFLVLLSVGLLAVKWSESVEFFRRGSVTSAGCSWG